MLQKIYLWNMLLKKKITFKTGRKYSSNIDQTRFERAKNEEIN